MDDIIVINNLYFKKHKFIKNLLLEDKCKLTFKCENLNFVVPHKNLQFRNFVLFPLKEISPKWKHPISDESIDNLIENLSNEDKNSILKV